MKLDQLQPVTVMLSPELAEQLQALRRRKHPTSNPASPAVLGHFLVGIVRQVLDEQLATSTPVRPGQMRLVETTHSGRSARA
jgi:hypothetical protein